MGEAPFYVEVQDRLVSLPEGKHERLDVTFKATSDFFLKIKDEVNPDEAFLSRKYEISRLIVDRVSLEVDYRFTPDGLFP